MQKKEDQDLKTRNYIKRRFSSRGSNSKRDSTIAQQVNLEMNRKGKKEKHLK